MKNINPHFQIPWLILGFLVMSAFSNSLVDTRQPCTILPPPTLLSSNSTNTSKQTLQQILSNGIDQLSVDKRSKTAIFIMGNSGSGKTKLTQILNGNLSQLHAVQTHTGSTVIINDNERIGIPTKKSKIVVPEYVVNSENNVSFYDCPGFDDNREANEDIAATYFLNLITEHVEQAKFLFLVTHSSVILGNDRVDFELLVTHASRFLKSMNKFNNSIGLIVTKVNSFSERGEYLTDDEVLLGIVGFIQEFQITLKERLEEEQELGNSERGIWERKLQFIDAILQQDNNGQYSKIWFVRNPPRCGRFSKIPYVSQVKRKTTDLYTNKLEYSPATQEDFGFTLKNKTLLKIKDEFIPQTSSIMTQITSNLVDELLTKYQSEFTAEFNSAQGIESALRKIDQIHNSLKDLRLSFQNQSLHGVSEKVGRIFRVFGYTVPVSYLEEIEMNEDVLRFYEKMIMASISKPPLQPFIIRLEHHVGTLKAQSLKYIKDIWIPDIISNITAIITSLFDKLEKAFMDRFYTDLNRVTMPQKLESLKGHYELAHQLENKWRTSTSPEYNSSSSQETILSEISELFASFDYGIPEEQVAAINKYENLLDSFGDIGESPVKRNLRRWLQTPANFIRKLESYYDWYDFVNATDGKLREYTTQTSILSRNPQEFALINWKIADGLEFVEHYKAADIPTRIREISRDLVTEKDKQHLNDVVQNGLSPTTVQCKDGGRKGLVTGNYVKFSDFIPWPVTPDCNFYLLKELTVFASEVLFFDKDLIIKGRELTMRVIADTWEVIGNEGPSYRLIDLSGSDGENFSRAGDGFEIGGDGKHGVPGNPGGNGGNFYGIYRKDINGQALEIDVSGGNGGNGQDGGNGQKGRNGRDATYDDFPSLWSWSTEGLRVTHINTTIGYVLQWEEKSGGNAAVGGNGGNGGIAGVAGFPGDGKVVKVEDSRDILTFIRRGKGKNGFDGRFGLGRMGGKHGNHYGCYIRAKLWRDSCESVQVNEWANNGRNGIAGGNSDGIILPVVPSKPSLGSETITEFKLFILESRSLRGRQFVSQINENKEIKEDYLSVFTIGEELINLESIFYKQIAFPQTYIYEYQDLLWRIDEYFQTHQMSSYSEQLNFLNLLRVSTFSKLMAINQQQTSPDMVINVADYFKTVKEEIQRLRSVQADFSISRKNREFKSQIESQILEAYSIIHSDVLPKLSELELELEQNAANTVNELESLEESAIETKEKLKIQEKKMEKVAIFQKLLGGLSLVGMVARFFGPKGIAISMATSTVQSLGYALLPNVQPLTVPHQLSQFMAGNHGKFMLHKNESVPFIIQLTRKVITEQQLPQLCSSLSKFEETYTNLLNITNLQSNLEPIHPDNILTAHQQFDLKFKELVDTLVTTKNSLFVNQSRAYHYHPLENLIQTITIANTNYPLVATLKQDSSLPANSNDSPEMKGMNELIRNIEKKKQAIYHSVIPIVKLSTSSLSQEARNLSESSSAALKAKKWKVQGMLKDVKLNLQGMLSGTSAGEEVLSCVDKLDNAMAILIDLYDQVEKYEERKQLADYIASVNSFGKDSSVNDPIIKSMSEKLLFFVKANLFLYEYEMAIGALKQWAFPFASLYLGNEIQGQILIPGLEKEISKTNLEGIVNIYTRRIDHLSNQLEKYKAMIVGNDEILFKSNFTKENSATGPFYIWKHDEWQNSIEELLSGNPVLFNTDIWKSDWRKGAVKFRKIELYLRVQNKSMQNELREVLNHYHLVMSHSGISYYKFLDQVFVIRGKRQVLEFSFRRSDNNTPITQNLVASKFNGPGDCLLSPFTYWTFQLKDMRKVLERNGDLLKFAPFIDLELQGDGIYIDESGVDKSKLLQLNVNEYYHNENINFT